MTDLHMILLGLGVVLMIAFAYIVKLRRDYYREFISGVPLRFYREGGYESKGPDAGTIVVPVV